MGISSQQTLSDLLILDNGGGLSLKTLLSTPFMNSVVAACDEYSSTSTKNEDDSILLPVLRLQRTVERVANFSSTSLSDYSPMHEIQQISMPVRPERFPK
jgi:hypothetical protein